MNFKQRIDAFDKEIATIDESIAKGREGWKKIGDEIASLEAAAGALEQKLSIKRAEAKAHRLATNAEVARRDGSSAARAKLAEQIERKLSAIDVPVTIGEAGALFPKDYPNVAKLPAEKQAETVSIPAGKVAAAKKIPVEDVITGAGKAINWDTLDAK